MQSKTRHIFPTALNNLPSHLPDCGSGPSNCFGCLTCDNFPCGTLPALFNIATFETRNTLRLAMDKTKQRAVGILFVFGAILVLMATWDSPEDRPTQVN